MPAEHHERHKNSGPEHRAMKRAVFQWKQEKHSEIRESRDGDCANRYDDGGNQRAVPESEARAARKERNDVHPNWKEPLRERRRSKPTLPFARLRPKLRAIY